MKKLFCLLLLLPLGIGCKKALTDGNNQQPYDKISPATAFNSEGDLLLYVNSFYNMLPTGDDITHGDAMSDYTARNAPPAFLIPDGYNSKDAGGWTWTTLRNVNYFLVHAPDAARKAGVRDDVINDYVGIARFFRAYFYFGMVNIPEWHQKIFHDFETAKWIVTQGNDVNIQANNHYRSSEQSLHQDKLLGDYIDNNFTVVKTIGWFKIYKRKILIK